MGELTATIAITAEVRDEKESKPAFADLSIFRGGHYLALFRLYYPETHDAEQYELFLAGKVKRLLFGNSPYKEMMGVQLEWMGLHDIKIAIWDRQGPVVNGSLLLIIPAGVLTRPLRQLIEFLRK